MRAILASVPRGTLDLIIAPECIIDGYVASQAPNDPRERWAERDRWVKECALSPSHAILRDAGAQADRVGAYLVLGFTELVSPAKAANSARVFDRTGRPIAAYRKTHLQNHDLQYEAGMGWTIVKADFGSFGILICADRRWPEAVRCQRLAGAEMVAIPSYGMHGDLNLAMMRTRAYENGFYLAFAHPKESLVVNPKGEVEIDFRSEQDVLVTHEIDLCELDNSHLMDRRPDLYSELLGT